MKIKLSILLFFLCLNLSGQSIPDQPNFCLGDVLAITGGTCLSDAFTNSDATFFDPTYGSKDMNPQCLCGFRNYGCIPDAPIATAASNVYLCGASTCFTMNWDASNCATGYWIEVDDNIYFTDPHPVGGVGNVLSYNTTYLAGVTFYYHVKAYNGSKESEYSNIITVTTACPAVGASHQGGIIFYLFVDGNPGYVAGECHGLIRTTGIISMPIYWHATNDGLVSGTSVSIGTGNANTNKIVTTYGAENNAAKLCSDLSEGGYTDWYLPSANELALLLIGFPDSGYEYWSSSEHSVSQAYRYKYNPVSMYYEPEAYYKEDGGLVYAIRSF